MRKSTEPVTPESIAAKLDQFCRYAVSLGEKQETLAERIKPFLGGKKPADIRIPYQSQTVAGRYKRDYLPPPEATLESISISIAAIAQSLRDMEIDSLQMRANLDQILSDANSRAQLQRHIRR